MAGVGSQSNLRKFGQGIKPKTAGRDPGEMERERMCLLVEWHMSETNLALLCAGWSSRNNKEL